MPRIWTTVTPKRNSFQGLLNEKGIPWIWCVTRPHLKKGTKNYLKNIAKINSCFLKIWSYHSQDIGNNHFKLTLIPKFVNYAKKAIYFKVHAHGPNIFLNCGSGHQHILRTSAIRECSPLHHIRVSILFQPIWPN